MRVKGISITNFRSIKTANYIPIDKKCIIIGPNNEGKSNILQGIVIALTKIFGKDNVRRRPIFSRNRDYYVSQIYNWERDFPLDLQTKKPNGKTSFEITFELSTQEVNELQKMLNIQISKDLLFKLTYDNSKCILKVKTNDKLFKNDLLDNLISFIHTRFSFYYIPAIRPTEYSIQIIEDLLEERLNILKQEKEYQNALKKILNFQKPIIDDLSNQLSNSIKSFVPEIKNVEIQRDEEISRSVSRSLSVFVEDNIKTEIQRKGDGIKSLMAISLVNHMALKHANDKTIFLALEEPESHLHPGAVHRLISIINEICETQQVVITTHSPILIDRSCINNNILVNKNTAKSADNIKSIREIIGVKTSDNLTNTSHVLLVEGKSDERILRKWLSNDDEIKKLLETNEFTIVPMSGGTNLSYQVSLYNSMLCDTLFFLDYDRCSIDAFCEAEKKDLLQQSDGCFARLQGVKESEIEDLIDVTVYSNNVFSEFGINLNIKKFTSLKGKWSDNVKKIFNSSGKIWNQDVEDRLKTIVADSIEQYNDCGIKKSCSGPVDNLIAIIKERIK